ncbi:MAG TPA: Spy/CpxP family protein refolding chaperone, partial [Leptospiraceae bacterium]|nr:Spy/CpxP family protein refolding chaperone [Leptospiraceae bacterium]
GAGLVILRFAGTNGPPAGSYDWETAMNNKYVFGAAGVVLGACLTVGAGAAMWRCYGPMGSPETRAAWVVKKLSSDLDLDATQIQKLTAIKDEVLKHRAATASGREEMHKAVLAQVESANVDKAALNKIFDSHMSDMKDSRVFLIDKFAEFHSILRDDQKKTLKKKMEHFLMSHDAPI